MKPDASFLIRFKNSNAPLWIEKLQARVLRKRSINLPDRQRIEKYERKGKAELKKTWEKYLTKNKKNPESVKNFFCSLYQDTAKITNFFNRYKRVFIFDSYYTFSIGHLAILWDSAQRIKPRNDAGIILVFNKWMHCGIFFNSLLKMYLKDKILIINCKKNYNWKNFFLKHPIFRGVKSDSIPFENPTWHPQKYLNHRNKYLLKTRSSHFAAEWLKSKSNHKQSLAHIIFHLRTKDFRGWSSVRDGRELHSYQEYFTFLKNLGLIAVVFGPQLREQIKDALFISCFDDVSENIQLGLIQSALIVVGNLSGITHLGPSFCIPTVAFDVPSAINFGNPNFNKILFRPVIDKTGQSVPKDIYFKYDKAIPCDVEGGLQIQKAGYCLEKCPNEELIIATLQSLEQIAQSFPKRTWESKVSRKILRKFPNRKVTQKTAGNPGFISRGSKIKVVGEKYFYVPCREQIL